MFLSAFYILEDWITTDLLLVDPEFVETMDSLMSDLLIAGVARAIDAPVVTHNVEDFELFNGVSVERY